MADRKITDLTALTTPASADVLPIVDVSEAAAADKNKKITVGELFKGIPDGTAAAPAIAFESDDGNGLFLSTTDTIGIATNGVSRATVSTTAVTSTLPVIVPDGSAAAPSVAFTGSGTDTGLYSPGADQVAISTNGTGRLFVDASGNVGISYSTPSNFAGGDLGATAPVVIGDGTATRNLTLFGANNGYGSVAFADSTTGSAKYAGLIQYYHTDNSLQFYTNSTERLRITSDGKVGVGTSSPPSILTVNGTDPLITFQNAATNRWQLGYENTNSHRFVLYDTNAAAYRLVVDSSGRLGIGTSSPVDRLHVDGRIAVSTDSSTPTTGEAFFYKSASGAVMSGFGATIETGSAGSRQARVSVDSTGRVGIGTTAPAMKLTINDTTTAQLQFGYSDSIYGRIGRDSSGNYEFSSYENGGSLKFGTTGTTGSTTERARIDSSGRLLVGTSSSRGNTYNSASGNDHAVQIEGTSFGSASFSIVRNSNDLSPAHFTIGKTRGTSVGSNTVVQSGDLLARIGFLGADGSDLAEGAYIDCVVDGTPGNNDMPARLVFSTTADGASSPTERMRIGNDGYVYIKQMAVGGTANMHWSSTAGQLFVTSSSLRFKKDIVDYDKGLAEVMQMQPKYFVYNQEPGGKRRAGFIAEDFDALGLTEYVEYWKGEEGEDLPSEIGYSNMVAILVKAIQELKAEVDDLKSQLA